MLSASCYTTAHFTTNHAKEVGEANIEKYHALAAKYTTTVQLKTVDISSENLAEELKAALDQDSMALVSGVMEETLDGTMENKAQYEKLVLCIKAVVTSGKHYIHMLGPHTTPYPHSKLLDKLEDGTYTLDGGFWAPGVPMPEETIVAEFNANGQLELTTNLMCSVLSNFNRIKTPGITPRILGCNPDKVPKEAMDVEILSAEHAIQLAKAIATLADPAKYMNTDAEDAAVTKTMANLEKIKSKKDLDLEDITTLKRKLVEDKPATIAGLCQDIYAKLCVAEAFDVQKKLGQLPILTPKWFDVVKGTPTPKYRDFDAQDLRNLGVNSIMQAFVIMLRIHAGDTALWDRLVFDLETGNVPVESAMHDPVKADKSTLAPGASKYLFGGRFPDRSWGSFCGCSRYVIKPDGLVHSDGQPQVGHLGNGAELVRQAIKGDKDVLAFLGLEEKLSPENTGSGAAKAFDLFWELVKS